MKFIALVSGGKDSCYSILHSIRQGHEIVALGNLHPVDESQQELDSYMFQTVGHDIVKWYQKCTGLPLIRRAIRPATSKNVSLNYFPTEEDEIEDLLELLKEAKRLIPDLAAVNAGAILSSYQRTRVEDVCSRLGLVSLSYLWQRNQKQLMTEMCYMSKLDCEEHAQKMDARLIKTAAVGLDQQVLGKSLPQIFPLLLKLNERYDVHICGEGGEFETMVFDAPIFHHGYLRAHVLETEGSDNSDGVYSARMEVEFVERENSQTLSNLLKDLPVPKVLEDPWMELLEQVTIAVDDPNDIEYPYKEEIPHSSNTSINEIKNLMYVSNITPKNGDTVETKTRDVFAQLNEILKKRSLFPSQILASSLLLEKMSNFASVNAVYNDFFQVTNNGPLPPSRSCVGSSLVGRNKTLQLSVIVDTEGKIREQKNMVFNETKGGLHVQGRSYWAPCNIGPYSQAIWNKDDANQISYISGQIGLIPATMIMTGALDEKTNDNVSQAVLSLRHFDTIKIAINAQHQLTTVCYVSEEFMVPIVAKVWALYCKEMAASVDSWFERPTEDPRSLIIVKISELPREAKCEWGGVACSRLTAESDDCYESDSDGNACDISKTSNAPHLPEGFSVSVQNSKKCRTYYTGFLDSQKELERFIETRTISQATIFYQPTFGLPVNISQNGIELFPVEKVYDHNGCEKLVGIQMVC
ncbi:LANO_0H05336g1_1 [Lachancea nothofagi CBS 11611]|uniref:Diphthine--ammonia ligase n=1 Tax=Lachancea nothofagi CBS 11611 TaxID=1266666 RepID=A0A1G4KLI9_9SACH|nr:LANO_0H05336g1_1 [Lachancea nothofagi CBS 11611]